MGGTAIVHVRVFLLGVYWICLTASSGILWKRATRNYDGGPLFLPTSKHEDINTSFEPEVVRGETYEQTNDDELLDEPEGHHSVERSLSEPLAVAPIVGEEQQRLTRMASLKPQAVTPEISPALAEKKKVAYDATRVPTESHPLFAFASNHYNLTAPAKSLFHKPKQLELRTRLYWESGLITTPITELPKHQTKVALQAFRNISGFMGNRSSGKGQIDHCFKLLRNVAPKSPDLKDEIYCQLCKQLTGNPDVYV